MSLSVGDVVRVDPSFFEKYKRKYLGLRPSPDVQIHDETSPGLASPDDLLLVIGLTEILPHRVGGRLVYYDIHVLHPRGFTGWIYENNLIVVQ